jgi:hypothetical protein
MRFKALLMLLAAGLAGCGGSGPPAASEPKEPQPTVFDPLTDTIERAQGVQRTVDAQAAELRKRVEEAER